MAEKGTTPIYVKAIPDRRRVRAKRATRRVRRSLRTFRWLYYRATSLTAVLVTTVAGLALAWSAGLTLPIGAAALASVAAMIVAMDQRRVPGDGTATDATPVARTWLVVFAIIVGASEVGSFGRAYLQLQRQRICGQIDVGHARRMPELKPGQSRTFTCRISSSQGVR